MLVYYSVLFGGQATIVDPKAERGEWKETLPDIAHEINIVNLTSENDNKGLLDPYVILKLPKDSESLAIDILTFLTGISSRDSEKFPVLRKAIRSVTQSKQRGLLLMNCEKKIRPSAIVLLTISKALSIMILPICYSVMAVSPNPLAWKNNSILFKWQIWSYPIPIALLKNTLPWNY